MDCPKCEADMTILEYTDDLDAIWITREWECQCPNCGYHGKYRKFYQFDDDEWERIEE